MKVQRKIENCCAALRVTHSTCTCVRHLDEDAPIATEHFAQADERFHWVDDVLK